ncbi:MAG TPA: hypothetical protein VFQ97_06435 [Gallionella sp.]|nr:hypothetical protein [Gallionella sp.]
MEFSPLIVVIAIVWFIYKRNKSSGTAEGISIGRLLSWIIVVIFFLIPVNWFRLWFVGDIPKSSTLGELLIGTLICWGVSAGLGYFLIVSARGIKLRKAKDEQAMQELLAQPLTEIKPKQALLKSGEKAYGSIFASLQEVQTVGYSGGTSGVSLRVVKGLTVRTGGIRAHAVKDAVIVASGELVITDRRVLFAGDRKSFDIPLESILNVNNYSDGFCFHDSKKTYTLITDNDRDRMVFAIALNKVIRG